MTTFMLASRRASPASQPGWPRASAPQPRTSSADPRSRCGGSTEGSIRNRARARKCSGAWIGICVPGVNRPCLYGLRSTVNGRQVRPDATVVEECVRLARRSVAHDRPALAALLDEEREHIALCMAPGPRTHGSRTRQPIPTGAPRRHLEHPRPFLGPLRVGRAGAASPHASAAIDIDDRQAMGGEDPAQGEHREIRKVLVVDRVELVLGQQAEQMGHLDRQEALAASRTARPPRSR